MPHQLEPNIETLFLLINTPWQEKNKAEALKELDSTGVDGSAFYNQNGSIIDRYYAAFEKEKVESQGTALLSEVDTLLLRIYINLFWHHPEWVEDIESSTDEALSEAVKCQVIKAVEGQEDIIAGLENLGVLDQSKWQVMVLMQKSRQQLSAVFHAVSENIPAFEKAKAKVSGELSELLEQFDAFAENTYGTWPLDLSRAIDSSAPIIPTLAMPFSVFIPDDMCFCGLLCHKLFRSVGGELSKDELLVCAKALSDKSKLDILLCLKEESLYGLEIAEKMGLTPATVSHHMGILLATGFVELEKRGGKVFYQLSKIGIQKFLSGASQLLL